MGSKKERFFATAFFVFFIGLFRELVYVKDNHTSFDFSAVLADMAIAVIIGWIATLVRGR